MNANDIKSIEAIAGAKVIAATKENSVFNSDFVLLNDNGVIRQAFTVRDINGKMCVDIMPGEYDSPTAALAYLNMSNEELAQNIDFIEEDSPTAETSELSHAGRFGVFGSCDNCTLPDAVEFIGDAISNHFAQFGLNVEFVNA